ncbi:M15 family metallopeptidase [Mycolicibacterium sp.]|uniref:M15 family metallopeptidase n=1 Tax=Mycolicibacterium sp. TaxID=2320850 RepID=UPI003D0B55B7
MPRTRRLNRLAAVTAVAAVLVQCASPPEPTAPTASRGPTATPSPAPAPPTTSPSPSAPAVHLVTAEQLGTTWRPGCPVGPDQLRLVELDHWGIDGRTHRGRLVVHQDTVEGVLEIFADLHRLRFPIERMRTVEHYPGADDELSMRDNNTSAFNCRDIPGTGRWSLHAYGRAIDLNPRQNPYVDSRGDFQPANAGPYLDRTRTEPGMLHDGDPAVLVFTDRGWAWGGHWRTPLDYQHFELRSANSQ